MGKTKTVTTVEEETRPRDPDQTLEEWLSECAADAEVQAIRVFRRNSLGQWSWLRKYDMMPPFTNFDPTPIFTEFGDGQYRFAPVKKGHFAAGGRYEIVEGYGLGTRPVSPAGPAEGDESGMDRLLAKIERQLDMESKMITLEEFEERQERRRLRREGKLSGYAAEGPPQENTQLLMMEMMTTVMKTLLERQLTVEPATQQVETLTKLIELSRSLTAGPAGELPGWEQILPAMLLAGVATPEMRTQLFSRLFPGIQSAPHAAVPAIPDTPAPVAISPGTTPPSESAPRPSSPATPPGVSEPVRMLHTYVLPLIKSAIDRRSQNYEMYVSLVDEHTPGFLDDWEKHGFEAGVQFLTAADPFFGTPDATAWLRAFFETLMQEEPATPEAPYSPAGPA